MTAEAVSSLLEAVADSLGGTLRSWREVSSEPTGSGSVTGYELDLDGSDVPIPSHLVHVEHGAVAEADDVAVLENPETGERVRVWVYPNDPHLPALAAAVFPETAAQLLNRLGVPTVHPTLEVLAYRPGRRAVIRVGTEHGRRVYLKVVRPALAERLANTHRAFRAGGLTVPEVIGWSDQGLLALIELPGVPSTDLLSTVPVTTHRSADPDEFAANLARLTRSFSDVDVDIPARRSLASRADWYVSRAIEVNPEFSERVSRLGEQITELLTAAAPCPSPEVIHGDLHPGQLFIDPSDPERIVGLLDIDTAGLGDPADDAAAMAAQLIVHDLSAPPGSSAAMPLAGALRATWPTSADRGFSGRADAITAVHLLGLLLRRTHGARADLDAAVISAAEAVVESALVGLAPGRHSAPDTAPSVAD